MSFANNYNIRSQSLLWKVPRGGETTTAATMTNEEAEKEQAQLLKWRMDQQVLLQLRSIWLSEALAARGIPIATMKDVSTAEGDKPPEKVDWDCAMSTKDEPKSCLYSFDAEPNTKVIAPINTDQWISLTALNRLRRSDPSKVEPMWHSQYAILDSWFSTAAVGAEEDFSLLNYLGPGGYIISGILLGKNGLVLRSLLLFSILTVLGVCFPLLEYITNRFLVSAALWSRWTNWSRFAHAALPLKLLMAQMTWKFLAVSFTKLETRVREIVVDMECAILEESVPLTVGPGSEEDTFELEDDIPDLGDDGDGLGDEDLDEAEDDED